ncbi:MAG TPA: gamma-glutamyltransferase, partial [Burkholderiaceae bacterium]|nr:gamma-glutamyltransferase [Burkholderiaceae bacterium]
MQAFDFKTTYATPRRPVFARNIVATSHPLAAQAGLRMIAAGGNAVDAAIAAAAVMTLVEPCSNGLGSDSFCILWDGTRLHGLNASGPAPALWTPQYFRDQHGGGVAPPARGWGSVTVPGAVASWAAMSQRFGKLPFGDLLAPAIDIAERGYAVPVIVQQKWRLAFAVKELVSQPGYAEVFLPHGRPPEVGELMRMPGAARALRAIAATRGEAFYRGEIAQAIERQARSQGGALRASDLAGYEPQWVEPIGVDYRGYRLHEIPPNGQGIAALIALGIAEHFGLVDMPIDGVAAQHLLIEAMKLGFADTYRYVAEPSAMSVTPAQMLDRAYLKARAKLIDP